MARGLKEHFHFSHLVDEESGSGPAKEKTVVIIHFVSLSSLASSKFVFTNGIVSLVFY